jgi:toxin ParE1/3/4
MARFTVLFDRDARADLSGIRDHIARARGAAFAESFVERIIIYCESLATVPYRGTRRDNILPGVHLGGAKP